MNQGFLGLAAATPSPHHTSFPPTPDLGCVSRLRPPLPSPSLLHKPLPIPLAFPLAGGLAFPHPRLSD